MKDPVARGIAAAALAVASVALVAALYAIDLGQQYLDDVHTLGETLELRLGHPGTEPIQLRPPPIQLETDDR